ncbi:hypothetical protein GPALN_003719 [Globodera pallida]|uniref:FMRFamide-related neuropeptide n=1 Tax=Globodera pallida TaxID=36090 RepID=A0A183CDJ6_GLOPA|nr:hypothetical protein GPALN_003719 [Globodera pallida]
MLRPLRTVLLLLCLMCAHCNFAKPTNSMTRIQEVFRTLMGPKPMMLASRGKKASALFGDGDRVPNPREFFDGGEEGPTEVLRDPAAFWVMADERGVPVAALRSYWTAARRRR